jgi:hypothetical protein
MFETDGGRCDMKKGNGVPWEKVPMMFRQVKNHTEA